MKEKKSASCRIRTCFHNIQKLPGYSQQQRRRRQRASWTGTTCGTGREGEGVMEGDEEVVRIAARLVRIKGASCELVGTRGRDQRAGEQGSEHVHSIIPLHEASSADWPRSITALVLTSFALHPPISSPRHRAPSQRAITGPEHEGERKQQRHDGARSGRTWANMRKAPK